MNFDPKVVRRALMVAKDLATKIDPGFAVHNLPMPPQGVPLERAKGGEVKNVLPVGSEERSSNLREWLGNSFLHDDGNPRTYYHGTSKDKPFTGFKVGRHGAWFTSDPKDASMYAEANDSMSSRFEGGRFVPQNTASRVMPVYLKASNPFLGEFPEKYKNAENYKKAQSEWFDQLRANGYDSWIPRSQEGNLAVMLEGPHQVKSAIGNVGTFDPSSPDIAKAEGGPIKTVEGPDRERNLAAFMQNAHPAVLNQDGTPKVLYHGTRSDIQEFKKKGIKPNFTSPQKHLGHFFTDDTKYANQYAQGAEEGIDGNVMPVYLALKNPKIEPLSRINDIEGYWPHWKTKAYKQDLLSQGHDGIIFSGLNRVGEPINEYVAFDPNQIKSAVGNVGAFDPASPDITKAEGGAVDDETQARNLNPMGMYSAAAEAARNLPQERGTPQQMLATMKGVKPDELRWSGVQDKFAGQKTVTRDELAQHFEQRMPPLRENVRVESATEGPDAKYGQYTLPGGQNYREVVMHMRPEDVEQTYPGEKMSYKSSHWQEPNVVAHLRLKDREFAPAKKPPKPDTQANIMMNTPLDPSGQALRPVDAWSTPTPGLVVTKSLESDEKGQYRVTHLGTGLNASGGNAYPFHQAMDAAKRLGEIWDGWTQDPDTVKAWAKENGKVARDALKQASNPFGKKVLHIEELQSDWAQQGRDAGFRNAAALEKANAEMEKWKVEMAKTYKQSLEDRLSSGQSLQPFEKEKILQGHYQDLNNIKNYFDRNGFSVVAQPLENDKHGLFLKHKDGDPVDEDQLVKNLGSSAIYDLSRMRKSFDEIENFDKRAKEDPAYRKFKINTHVDGLSPQYLAERLGQSAIEKTEELAKAIAKDGGGHDEGPYVTNTNQWTDLGLKRALVEAARGGYDKLIWTPGEAQADRYKLNNFIDNLEYKKLDDGRYHIVAGKDGRKVLSEQVAEKELPGVVGREMAKKMMEGHGEPTKWSNIPGEGSKVISGLDLNVGGRGMYEYYDNILPRRLMALAQEHDPEAQIKPLKGAPGKIKNLPSLDITPRMRDSILKRGFKAFKRGGAVQGHLFHHHDEPKSIEVPVMDRERAIRRALMIAKAEGGTVEKPAKVRKTAMDFLPESLPDVSINSLTKAFTEGINEHLALPDKQRIQNSRAAKKVIASRNGSGALLAKNGKLMKTETGAGDSDPVELPDGRGIETTGLSLAPAFQAGKFNTCPNHASCKASCLGVTSGGNFMFGGGRDLEEIKGPRLAHLKNTLAMILHPKEFAVRLNDEITAAKQQAEANGNKLGVRLNVLSDLHPRAYEALIKAHPDVDFYDYTKLDSNPIAPNHHLTYSSTGVAQPAGVNGNTTDVDNEHQNWRRMRRRLDTGSNVAMAFSHGSVLPEFVHDLESGKQYRVVNGDDHDFRPMDRQPEGSDGVIVGLKNKKAFGKEQEAHIDSNGFFTYYDPKIVKSPMGGNMVTNNTVQIAPQPGARRMMTNDSTPEGMQNG